MRINKDVVKDNISNIQSAISKLKASSSSLESTYASLDSDIKSNVVGMAEARDLLSEAISFGNQVIEKCNSFVEAGDNAEKDLLSLGIGNNKENDNKGQDLLHDIGNFVQNAINGFSDFVSNIGDNKEGSSNKAPSKLTIEDYKENLSTIKEKISEQAQQIVDNFFNNVNDIGEKYKTEIKTAAYNAIVYGSYIRMSDYGVGTDEFSSNWDLYKDTFGGHVLDNYEDFEFIPEKYQSDEEYRKALLSLAFGHETADEKRDIVWDALCETDERNKKDGEVYESLDIIDRVEEIDETLQMDGKEHSEETIKEMAKEIQGYSSIYDDLENREFVLSDVFYINDRHAWSEAIKDTEAFKRLSQYKNFADENEIYEMTDNVEFLSAIYQYGGVEALYKVFYDCKSEQYKDYNLTDNEIKESMYNIDLIINYSITQNAVNNIGQPVTEALSNLNTVDDTGETMELLLAKNLDTESLSDEQIQGARNEIDKYWKQYCNNSEVYSDFIDEDFVKAYALLKEENPDLAKRLFNMTDDKDRGILDEQVMEKWANYVAKNRVKEMTSGEEDYFQAVKGAVYSWAYGFGYGTTGFVDGIVDIFAADGKMNGREMEQMYISNYLAGDYSLYAQYKNKNQAVVDKLSTEYSNDYISSLGIENLTRENLDEIIVACQEENMPHYELEYMLGKIDYPTYLSYRALANASEEDVNFYANLEESGKEKVGLTKDASKMLFDNGNSVGNMAIPTVVGLAGTAVGGAGMAGLAEALKWTSTGLLTASTLGKTREELMQQGETDNTYIWTNAALHALVEGAGEAVFGEVLPKTKLGAKLSNAIEKIPGVGKIAGLSDDVTDLLEGMGFDKGAAKYLSSVFVGEPLEEIGENTVGHLADFGTNLGFKGKETAINNLPKIGDYLKEQWETYKQTVGSTAVINGAQNLATSHMKSNFNVNGKRVNIYDLNLYTDEETGKIDFKGLAKHLIDSGKFTINDFTSTGKNVNPNTIVLNDDEYVVSDGQDKVTALQDGIEGELTEEELSQVWGAGVLSDIKGKLPFGRNKKETDTKLVNTEGELEEHALKDVVAGVPYEYGKERFNGVQSQEKQELNTVQDETERELTEEELSQVWGAGVLSDIKGKLPFGRNKKETDTKLVNTEGELEEHALKDVVAGVPYEYGKERFNGVQSQENNQSAIDISKYVDSKMIMSRLMQISKEIENNPNNQKLLEEQEALIKKFKMYNEVGNQKTIENVDIIPTEEITKAWEKEDLKKIFSSYSDIDKILEMIRNGNLTSFNFKDKFKYGENITWKWERNIKENQALQYTDFEHPLLTSDYFGNYMNEEFYNLHKEEILKAFKDYYRNTTNGYFEVYSYQFDDEVLDILLNKDKIFSIELKEINLSEEQIKKIKRKFIDVYVENEEGIQQISSKYVIPSFTMKEIESKNEIIINEKTLSEITSVAGFKYIDSEKPIKFSNYGHQDEDTYLAKLSSVLKDMNNLGKKFIVKIGVEKRSLFSKYFSDIDLSNIDLTIDNDLYDYSYQEYLAEEAKLNNLVANIKNTELSPLEKFMAVYDIVKKFKPYKENDENRDQARKLRYILDNEYMVCVGYAKLLQTLLDKVGIDANQLSVTVDTSYDEGFTLEEKSVEHGGHARVMVSLDDDKYNVHGLFVSDPTWDNDLEKNYLNNALMTADKMDVARRMFYFSKYYPILDVHNFQEFNEQVNFVLARKIEDRKKSFYYSPHRTYEANTRLLILDGYKDTVETLLDTNIKSDPKYNEFKERLLFCENENDYKELLTDFGYYLLERTNKEIDSKIIIDADINAKEKLGQIVSREQTEQDYVNEDIIAFPYEVIGEHQLKAKVDNTSDEIELVKNSNSEKADESYKTDESLEPYIMGEQSKNQLDQINQHDGSKEKKAFDNVKLNQKIGKFQATYSRNEMLQFVNENNEFDYFEFLKYLLLNKRITAKDTDAKNSFINSFSTISDMYKDSENKLKKMRIDLSGLQVAIAYGMQDLTQNLMDVDRLELLINSILKAEKIENIVSALAANPFFREKHLNDLKRCAYFVSNIKKTIIENKNVGSVGYNGTQIELFGNDMKLLEKSAVRIKRAFDKLPQVLRDRLKSIKIYDESDPENLSALLQYYPNSKIHFKFTSAADYNHYSQEIRFFKDGLIDVSDADLLRTLKHELGHTLDATYFDNNGYFTETYDVWKNAKEKDLLFVSFYGNTNIKEDFAESVMGYTTNKALFRLKCPNRAKVLDAIFDSCSPGAIDINRKLEIMNILKGSVELTEKMSYRLFSKEDIVHMTGDQIRQFDKIRWSYYE